MYECVKLNYNYFFLLYRYKKFDVKYELWN